MKYVGGNVFLAVLVALCTSLVLHRAMAKVTTALGSVQISDQ